MDDRKVVAATGVAVSSALIALAAARHAGCRQFQPGGARSRRQLRQPGDPQPAGYKRILWSVRATSSNEHAADAGPRVVYLDDEPYRVRNVYRCNRQPAVVRGRSYMYGLPDNGVPVPPSSQGTLQVARDRGDGPDLDTLVKALVRKRTPP
jgi:hypothetical protein